jgi:PAS domain S-box-containing protein
MKKTIFIVGIYLLVGSAWILFSSQLLYNIFDGNTALILRFEIYKGWFYVAITAILLYILISKEFNKLKNTQQQLFKSNEQYKQFFQLHPSALFLIDVETGIISNCNERAIRKLGYDRNEIIGKKANNFIQLSEEELLKHLEAQAKRELFYFRTSICLANGEIRFIEVFSNMQRIDDHDFYLAAVNDITDNLKNENMNTFVFDKGPAGIAAFEANGNIIRVNEAFSKFFDQEGNDLIGRNINELHNRIDVDFSKTCKIDIQFTTFMGVKRWGRLSLSEFIIDFGQNYRIGILEDITAQKEYESALKQFELVVEQSPSAIVVCNLDGRVEYINSKYTEITGYSPTEMIGSTIDFLGTYEQSQTQYLEMRKSILAGNVWKGEYLNRNRKGSIYWEQGIIAPLTDSEGNIVKYIGIKENISPQKEAQLEFILAKEQAERANKAKSDFLANLSHELRTPMNAIMGFTELLYESETDKAKASMLEIMRRSENDLIVQLNSLLHLSRIESGAISLQEEQFSIESLFVRIENNFRELAAKKSLMLLLEDKTKYEVDFVGDKNKIEHILDNLVDNAIKFTAKGNVKVEFQLDYSTNDRVFLVIIVSDTGIGVAPEMLERIFEKFEQGEHYLKKKYSGAGLGLAIVKQLTEFMGGTISLKSTLDVGSIFTVSIPIRSLINN